MAGWSAAGSHLRDSLDVAAGVLRHTRHTSVGLRRAGVFLLRFIVEGLSSKLFRMESGGEHLKAAYAVLKAACGDEDEVVCFQAQSALGNLSEYMRGQLFLSPDDARLSAMPMIQVLSTDKDRR